jgi:hydrogenase expression/formation protein HypE
MTNNSDFALSCPIPISDYPYIVMAHGGGGKLMRNLIEDMIVPTFNNPLLDQLGDGAVTKLKTQKLAFTTDSYVVHPLFFPGGDIGTLAVNGTVNDLAMCGARPVYLSAGFILEEGLPMETLWRVILSMQDAAAKADVQFITGDTKVVDRGKGDGIYINTTGIGAIEHDLAISPQNLRPGDAVILSGDIGRHGIAVMAVREGLSFESDITSDCAPLAGLVMMLLDKGVNIHCMRDLTRGGLGCALVEIAEAAKQDIRIEERAIPVSDNVRGACEILGLDPLYVANEGRFVCMIPSSETDQALKLMHSHPLGEGASLIGEAKGSTSGTVSMISQIGTTRIIDMPSGEQLPRIC